MEKFGKRFEGKVVIVTASTQGIGFTIAQRLGLEGASVVISSRKQSDLISVDGAGGRRQENVDEAVKKLRDGGIEVLGLVCHVSNAQQRKNLIEKTIQKYGKLDVVVSNAAVNPSVDSILETKESVLDKLWDINVKASILLLQDAAPYLKKGSSVVLISSVSGYSPPASMGMYGVTKTALFGLTKVPHTTNHARHLAELLTDQLPYLPENPGDHPYDRQENREQTSLRIERLHRPNCSLEKRPGPSPPERALAAEMSPDTRVNCIAPGFVPTHFADYILKNEQVRKEIESQTLLKRLGKTKDMAAAVAYLASDDASYVTGETLVVAGGMPSRL
ncbi:Tropinone reductase-like 3 [Capsicum annuum]|nr:Tropinone reductase-like 3 [Capsicum annuum]